VHDVDFRTVAWSVPANTVQIGDPVTVVVPHLEFPGKIVAGVTQSGRRMQSEAAVPRCAGQHMDLRASGSTRLLDHVQVRNPVPIVIGQIEEETVVPAGPGKPRRSMETEAREIRSTVQDVDLGLTTTADLLDGV